MPAEADQAELLAMRLILSNVVARLVVLETTNPEDRRKLLGGMSDACKLAAERYPVGPSGAEHAQSISRTLKHIDEFFKGITIA
jgi:hypothetical protein